MPASRSPNRAAERPPARHWPLLLLLLPGLAAVCVAVIFILPASLITRVLPPDIHADDFSGTLLHGAAGTLTVKSRNAGAVEWQLHLIPLLRLSLVADIHWVKLAFVLDGTVETDAHGVTATHVVGGGPIESLNDLGLNSGWTGAAAVDFSTPGNRFHQTAGGDRQDHGHPSSVEVHRQGRRSGQLPSAISQGCGGAGRQHQRQPSRIRVAHWPHRHKSAIRRTRTWACSQAPSWSVPMPRPRCGLSSTIWPNCVPGMHRDAFRWNWNSSSDRDDVYVAAPIVKKFSLLPSRSRKYPA